MMSGIESSFSRERLTSQDPQKSQHDEHVDDSRRHWLSTISLCLCSLANAFVIVSVFPYSGYMVLDLLPEKATPESAGTYAGVLAASFMLGRFATAYSWGTIADTYGRVVCLQASMILSAIFSILFGLSTSYRMAILFRICLGAANSVTSTAKTLASEISPTEQLEQRAMGLVIGMRSWGFLLGPAIGGFLADPVQQYPDAGSWLTGMQLVNEFPFILPNVLVAIFCILSSLSIYFFVDETLENRREWTLLSMSYTCYKDIRSGMKYLWKHVRSSLLSKPEHQNENAANTSAIGESSNLLPQQRQQSFSSHQSSSSVWGIPSTREHLIVMWIFSFVVVVIDEAFPLFSMSTIGGLSLQESAIGKILSLAGVLFAAGQYVVYSAVIHRVGLYPAIVLGGFFGLVPAVLIPISVYLQNHNQPRWMVHGYLSLLLGLSKIMACMCFSSLAIATNKTVPHHLRAKMNGIAVLGSSVAKGLGPLFAGALVSFSFSSIGVIPASYGSIIIFGTIGLLGVGASCLLSGLHSTNTNDD